jgi:osmoprotectant transport system permease protein
VVVSKRFTESYILGDIVSQAVTTAGHDRVVLKSGLGNTGILLSALRSGEIDLYPEYTGTITREILKTEQVLSLAEINARLLSSGLQAGVLLGFDNSYVLAVFSRHGFNDAAVIGSIGEAQATRLLIE